MSQFAEYGASYPALSELLILHFFKTSAKFLPVDAFILDENSKQFSRVFP